MQKSAAGAAAGTSFALLDQMVAVNDSTYHSAAAGGTTLGVTGSKAGATVTVSIPATITTAGAYGYSDVRKNGSSIHTSSGTFAPTAGNPVTDTFSADLVAGDQLTLYLRCSRGTITAKGGATLTVT